MAEILEAERIQKETQKAEEERLKIAEIQAATSAAEALRIQQENEAVLRAEQNVRLAKEMKMAMESANAELLMKMKEREE